MKIVLSTSKGLCTIRESRVEMPYLSMGECIDILFRIPRFGGQYKYFYTVGDHILAMVKFFQSASSNKYLGEFDVRHYLTCAIFHEMAEAVIGDVKNPIKSSRIRNIEGKILARLFSEWNKMLPEFTYSYNGRNISRSYIMKEGDFNSIDHYFARVEHIMFFGEDYDSERDFCFPPNYFPQGSDSERREKFKTELYSCISRTIDGLIHYQRSMSFDEMTETRQLKLKEITRTHLSWMTKNKVSEKTLNELGI